MVMIERSSIGLVTLVAALALSVGGAHPYDDSSYPDLRGAWARIGGAQWDPSRPGGLRQDAPYTSEYQAIYEANLKEQVSGGQDYNIQVRCFPGGMPRVMLAYYPIEVIVTPRATYVRADHLNEFRRIYTDGRNWPPAAKPNFEGYSIGKWLDRDGDGRFDVLEVETRNFKGSRLLDSNGLPLHKDNQTIVKESIWLDKANPNLLHDEITTIDNALTRPWTVMRDYRRVANPVWTQDACGEANNYVFIGADTYFLSVDGLLMPTRKGQPPPDLRHFDQVLNESSR
jgi:hypothetical protein